MDEIQKQLNDLKIDFEEFKRKEERDIREHQHDGLQATSVKEFNIFENKKESARFLLTSAQILALNTTPITLIQAIPNSFIVVEGITARLNFNTTAYTGANNLEFRYTDASGVKVTADMINTFLNSAATAYDNVAGVEAELTPVINSPIVVRVPTANPGAGNSTLDLFIKYYVVTF